ncbi:hypothetical protein F5887DRAFT_1077669 [Amanita rubescens]|nr:hypothetical protein F5887DRAFT_1077669 [Amanita rubescens]
MSSLSSEMGERRRVPDTVVSKIKGTMEETHSPFDNATLLLLESVQTFPILTPYNRPFVEGIVSSSFEVSTPVTLGVVNNGRLASIGTDQEVKTLTRVSSKTTVPRSDKPLAECSNLEEGYAVEQALAFSHSTKVGKGRQACNAAVINEQKEEEASSPSEVPVVPVQSVSTPDASSFTPVRDVPLRLFSDKYIPPVEELSRRHDVSVVCKTSEVCSSHSRSLETTRKRAIVSTVPFSVEGEGQLKRAAAYIQERIKRRSSMPDEFPRYGSKGPPDKRMEITSTAIESRRLETDVIRARLEARTTLTLSPCRTKGVKLSHSSPEATLELPDSSLGTSVTDGRDLKPRQLGQAVEAIRCSDECLKTEDSVLEESVIAPRVLKNEWAPGPDEGQPVSWKVVSKTEMRSACLHSPVTSAALTPFALLPAFLSQALPSSLLSSELSGFLTKSSGEGDCEWRHNKVTNSPNNLGVGTQSPESKIRVVTLVSKPSFSLSVHAKAQEQPIKAVLNVTFLSSSKRCENRESAKHSVDKVNIRAGKGLGAAERSPFTNAVSTLRRSLPVPSLRAPHARYFKDGATPSFPMNSTRRMLGVVNTHRVVSVMTHLKPETPSRVSHEVASTRSDKAPSAGAQGRSDERSNSAAGPAVEQALVLSSLKEGEERRACDAVISILRKNEGEFSPEASVAPTLPVCASAPSLVIPVQTANPRLPTAEPMSPINTVPRRCDLDIVCETLIASDRLHSPSSETAQKQSVPAGALSKDGKRTWLDRAATYVKERLNGRSSACDEFERCSHKGPPNKFRESETDEEIRRRRLIDVVNELKASGKPRSPCACPESSRLFRSLPKDGSPQCSSLPIHSCKKIRFTVTNLSPVLAVLHAAPMLLCSSESAPLPRLPSESAVSQQTVPSSRSSLELDGLVTKSSDDEDCKLRPCKVVSSSSFPGDGMHPPETKTGMLLPVSKPNVIRESASRILSIELEWRARFKPPNVAFEPERRNRSIVSKTVSSSATKHLLSAKAAFAPPISPSTRSLGMCNPRIARVLKPPDWAALRRLINGVVGIFELRRGLSCSRSNARLAPVFRCLRAALEIGS